MTPIGRVTTDVVVVGSGPNGLAAAVTMARAGLEVELLEAQPTLGGGARTLDLELADEVVHDVCSAVHPLATASPFFHAFDLRAHGVRLVAPEVSYAQPLDAGRAGVAYHDLAMTVEGLGPDGPAWQGLFGPLIRDARTVVGLSLGDMRSIPPGVLTPAGVRGGIAFGLRMLEQGTRLWNRRFATEVAPSLLSGIATHSISPLPRLAPAGVSLMLGTLAHTEGWTIPVGGSQAITDAMVADLRAHGGRVTTSRPVEDYRELPRARAYLFDTAPSAVERIWGARMPSAMARTLRGFPHGDAAAKVDYVLSGPVPWTHPEVARAGTVHVCGTRAEMAQAEAEVARGMHPASPMVLVSDPTIADPGREHGGRRPLWTYTHVPAGSREDVTEAVTAQIERFAPGFRDVVVASRCVPAARLHETNANYVGGDIAGGVVRMARIVAGPTGRWDPYACGIPGVYLCSSSTPPAPGVHGMNGWHAATRALSLRFGKPPPSLRPGD